MFFGEINPVLWGNVSISMLTLFRVLSLEGWVEVMYETMEVYPLSWIYYLSFIFLVTFVLLNIMVAILVDIWMAEGKHTALLDNDSMETLENRVEQLEKTVVGLSSKKTE